MTRERFDEMICQEQERLIRFLLALCDGNRTDAEDLYQEAILKAYLSIDRYVERFKFSTWLYRIAYNTFIDFCRKRSIKTVPLENVVMPPIFDNDCFKYERLYKAIEDLPINIKTAMLLFYQEDMKILDIADTMHKPTGTIKSYLNRGRQHIKNKLKNG